MTVDEFIEEWGSDVPYIEAHTSGSTGTPKLIRLPKSLVAESARRSIAHFGLDASSRRENGDCAGAVVWWRTEC